MARQLRSFAFVALPLLFLAGGALAQTSSLEGDVKGEDGKPLIGAWIKIERTDIKGNYKVKTDKKGHYFHAGLPLGTYNIALEVDGKVMDHVDKVRSRLGDPLPINFDLQKIKAQQMARQQAVESGKPMPMTQEQSREMSAAEKAALDKAMKERQQQLAKNKELNDAFNQGKDAITQKNFPAAVQALTKASELDANQHVVWASLAEAYTGLAAATTGAEQQAAFDKGIEAWGKAMALKPDDAAYHNNYALLLAKGKKFPEAQAELAKAAQLDPPNAGRYFYNLGALLVNSGQSEPAGEAFKKAIEADPNYADAQYQYGIYLIGKAVTTPDGKITPLPGTVEAFQKYLELKPDGPFADGAKGMLQTLSSSLQTEYKNPNAPAAKKAKKK